MQRLGLRDPIQHKPMDQKKALKEVAAQDVVWAKVALVPQVSSYALNALKRQKHQHHRKHLEVQWLLNSAAEVNLLIESMKQFKKQRLPVLRGGAFAGQPRIYAIMALCAICHDGKVDETTIEQTLLDFQAYRELYLCEVEQAQRSMQWVLLDIAGMEALAQTDRMQTCEGAHRAIRRLHMGQGAFERIRFAAMAGQVVYVAQLQRSLVNMPQDLFLHFGIVSAQALHLSPIDVNRIDRQETLQRRREIKNILFSLKALKRENGSSRYLNTHAAVNMLARQNAYTSLDDEGKAYMRKRIVSLANRANAQESEAVQKALLLCGNDGEDNLLLSYLWEDNKALYAALGLHFFDKRKAAGFCVNVLQWGLPMALNFIYLWAAISRHAAFLEVLGGWLFGVVVTHACAKQLSGHLAAHLVMPKRLPRLKQMPNDAKTVVVIPAIVETREQIDAQFWHMQVQSQAFTQAQQFILLCDFPESGQKKDELGEALTAYGAELARRLNDGQENRFSFATRTRAYVRKDGKWMGSERRRGALLALNAALLGRRDEIAVHGAQLPFGAKYVLALNGETSMPPGEAQRLVCTLAHPHNARYVLLQPRMATRASSLTESGLARIYAKPGLSTYHNVLSDDMMDIHEEGIYEGIGLYDLRRFTYAVRHLPSQQLLSHDFLEGALAGCALVSDVQAVEGFPTRYSSYTKREHRRIRGLWQLLPLVIGSMRSDEGSRIKLVMYHRFWIINQLMMTLVTLATTQLLAIATFSVLPFWYYVSMAFVPYICPILSSHGTALSVLWKHEEIMAYIYKVRRLAGRWITDVILCPYDASIAADAIVRALYRMAVSRRNLMQWMTDDQAEHGDAYTLAGYAAHMMPALLFNLLMVIFILINKPMHAWPIISIAAIWFTSPLLAMRLDTKPKTQPVRYPAFWTKLCKQTYDYFIMSALPSLRFLPPRGTGPAQEKAMPYTTPTDAAMALLAPVCAQALGFLCIREAVEQIALLLNTLEALPRWKGHPFHRIAPEDAPHTIRHVISTMDSANLCLALMVCEQALREWGEHHTAQRANSLWTAMDFTALYCKPCELFARGCGYPDGNLTEACHDMYTSEARLVSFLAVGRNQAEAAHLWHLRRMYRNRRMLIKPLSEHGTMQAYLMPSLFLMPSMYTYERTLTRCAICEQRKLARRKKRPLGVSDIGIIDENEVEQVPLHGIKSLARDPKAQGEDVVVPYAAALLAPFDEQEAYDTLCGMERLGLRSSYGFYDALCFDKDKKGKLQKAYVTRHQGIVLCALTNVLTGGQLTRWAAQSVPLAAVLPWYDCSC